MKLGVRQKIALFNRGRRTARNILFDSLFKARTVKFPRVIDIFVTERCNFSCRMCHVAESMAKNYSEEDLNFKYVKRIVDESKKWSPVFQIVGGEPTLYKHLVETARLISINRMICGLTTNGYLLEAMAKDLVDSGLSFLAVSLDGWDEDSQKKRGNVSGSFGRVARGIKQVLAHRAGNLFPIIRVATVITRDNYMYLDKIAEVVRNLGVDKWSISNHYFMPDSMVKKNNEFRIKKGIGEDIWAYKTGNDFYFSGEQVNRLRESLDNLRREYSDDIVIDYNWPVDLKKFYSGSFPAKSSKCLFPYRELMVRGNGNLELCQGFNLGNIGAAAIYDAWNGQRVRYFRSVFKSYGLMPACFRCCALNITF